MKHLLLSSFCIILITSSCYISSSDDTYEHCELPEIIKNEQAIIEAQKSKPLWTFPVINKIRQSFSAAPQQNQSATLETPQILPAPKKSKSENSFIIVEEESIHQESHDKTIVSPNTTTPVIQIITLDMLKKVKSVENIQNINSNTTNRTQTATISLHAQQKQCKLQNLQASTFTDFTDNTNNSESHDMTSSTFTDDTCNTDDTNNTHGANNPIHTKDMTHYNSYQQSSSKKINDTPITPVDEDLSLYSFLFCGCCNKKTVKDDLSQSTMSNDDPKKKAKLIELTNFIDGIVRI